MKKVSMFLMTVLLFLGIVSCSSNDDNTGDTIPSVEFHFQFSSFIVHQGENLTITPTIVKENSSPGLKIKKVGYYWDNELIATVDSEPFELNYEIKDQSIGSHTVIISLICDGEGYVQMKGTSQPYEVAVLE